MVPQIFDLECMLIVILHMVPQLFDLESKAFDDEMGVPQNI